MASVKIIPAMPQAGKTGSSVKEKPRLRVAAYCRVSTDTEEQATSYETQVEHYTEYISRNPEWTLAGIYADDGISGTNTKNRVEFNRMMDDCEAGRIDMIITKSISRFARNTLDCLKHIRALKAQNTPVYFEKESINPLDAKGEVLLTIMASLAQQKSQCPRTSSWGFSTATSRDRCWLTTTAFWATPRMRKAISSLIRNRLKS